MTPMRLAWARQGERSASSGVGDPAHLDQLGPPREGAGAASDVGHLLCVVFWIEAQASDSCRRVGCPHERFPYKAHAHPDVSVPLDVCRAGHAAKGAEDVLGPEGVCLGDGQVVVEGDSSPKELRCRPVRGGKVHLEGVEVAVVDPDYLGPGLEGHVELGPAVHLDEGLHAHGSRGIDEFPQQVGRRHRDDEEDGVGPVGGGLVDLIDGEDELLPEDGGAVVPLPCRGEPCGAQVGKGSLEPPLLGEDGNHRRPCLPVQCGLSRRRRVWVDDALGGAGPLELGSEAHGGRYRLDDGAKVEHGAVLGVEGGGLLDEFLDGHGPLLVPAVVQNPHRGHLLQHAEPVIRVAVAVDVVAAAVRGGGGTLDGPQGLHALCVRVTHDDFVL